MLKQLLYCRPIHFTTDHPDSNYLEASCPFAVRVCVYVAAEGISKESKRPDLLVLKPPAVLSLLDLLEAVDTAEGSPRRSWRSPDWQPQKLHL